MRILITNDDGILAPGLVALAGELSQFAVVRVIAPEREQSASGHSITLHKPLRMDPVQLNGLDVEAYSCNGTPADCVILGVLTSTLRPDLVVSGINRGANLGEEVLYSGTVSAAMEGALQGFKSLAVSVASYLVTDFSGAATVAADLVRRVAALELPDDCFLNVNLPDLRPEEMGAPVLTHLGRRAYINSVERREDPRGRPYYWFTGEAQEVQSGEGTDIGAVLAGHVSVTPVHFDLTNYGAIESLDLLTSSGSDLPEPGRN
jgi:5'-nucleotidase